MTDAPGEDAIDGINVDREGNLYVAARAASGSSRRTARSSG
jgi:sugar lactone lactonase YvrE